MLKFEFNDSLKVEILKDGRRCRLIEPYTIDHELGSIIIPKDFVTDFASVPRIFWCIISPWGKYSPAAVAHDYFYFRGRNRKASDKIFYELMKILNVPLWKRQIMYYAVRVGGWVAWNKHKKNGHHAQ